jgi:hypothetical protein
MRLALVILLSLLAQCAAAQTSSPAMFVKLDIPRRAPVLVTVTYEEALRLTNSKQTFTIGFWVEAALLKSRVPHRIGRLNGRDWVAEIAGVRETRKARWVVFVDGERLEVHMNTQPAAGAHSIKLVYEAP